MDERQGDVAQGIEHVVEHVPGELLGLGEDGEEQRQGDTELEDYQQHFQYTRQEEQNALGLADVEEFVAANLEGFEPA